MGVSNSKIEEDKALQLCRERKKFVRQALDGRCAVAAAHVTYIQSLKNTGTALRRFVEPEAPIESSLYTSTSATPEPLALTEKSLSQFSFSSPSASQRVDATETLSPSPSPPIRSQFQANHVRFRGTLSKKVEEKPSLPVIGTVTSSSTPLNTTPHSTERPETSPFEGSSVPPGTPPWDYFGLFNPVDHEFSFQDGKGMNQGLENADDIRQLREEEGGVPELEDDEEKASIYESEESQDSEDEFDDELATDTLVRSFENLNRAHNHGADNASPSMPSAGNEASETEFLNGEKGNSPYLSPLSTASKVVMLSTDTNKTPLKEDSTESKVAPKDFFSSIKDIESLFIKASDSGEEVPRMLEANKLHFRPIFQGKDRGGPMVSTFLKACFSCGEDPSKVPEEPAPENSMKYLTWHRTTSSRSSSSRNPLGANSKDDIDELNDNLFDNFCMISGSHASTLDRLYAWERKLYDEVKASGIVRKEYDLKCKILRQLESNGESSHKIDKTRAVVKDLHSRIRVAIHRIDSISKRIEDLRDKELQPQLEELIEGLSRMWEVMSECHKRQYHIISVVYNSGNTKISIHSESHRQITIYLENELSSLSSSFTKWVGAQRSYLQAINGWLYKCVSITQKVSKRKRKQPPPSLRDFGPPIFMTCDFWLEKLVSLDAKPLADSIKYLAAETARFVPRQEKNQGKDVNRPYLPSWKADNDSDSTKTLIDEASGDRNSGSNDFQSNLLEFLHRLYDFAESSVSMYVELRKAIESAKTRYSQRSKSQSQVV
ncbi:nitrate regulatory gene2 protein [Fagus crenata]